MRIVNRQQFMELPSGTIYRKFTTPYAFQEIEVKFDSYTLPNGKYIDPSTGQCSDFVCMGLAEVEWDETSQMFERLDEMMEQGASYPLDLDCAGRDGCFEPEAMFLVFERDDVIKLRDFLTELLATWP